MQRVIRIESASAVLDRFGIAARSLGLAMSKKNSDFWVFSFAQGIGSKAEERRWALDLRLRFTGAPDLVRMDSVLFERLKYGEGRLPESMPEFVAEAERSTDIEDVPWVHQSLLIVSERARSLIDEAGPSDCQYWPVEIRHRRRSLNLKYYLMHCNHTFECTECAKEGSIYASDSLPTIYIRFELKPEAIPEHIATFRVRQGIPEAIMRDSLRRKFMRHKISGCLFYHT